MSKLIKTDETYKKWIQDVSKRFKQSQIKASMKVNDEMLRFYWQLGAEMDKKKDSFSWGTDFYGQISNDLREALPGVKSFSPRNLRYMHKMYCLFPEAGILPQVEAKSETGEILPQVVAKSDDSLVFLIPWGHIRAIMDKNGKDKDKALFYVRKTLENNWSRSVLLNYLDTDLYERQGKAITNFALTLPEEQSDLAQELTKDPYSFDFISIRERYDEKELKDALVDKVEKFLMELGTGFAFIGREVRIEVGETEKFIDLLFYNTKQHCYVVVEVKATKFDSSYAGQLGTYVVAVNHQMKTDHDNQTLGLLVCKDMDKVEAQYALESSSQPLGVSRYELTKLIPEEFKSSMPTIEEIEAEFSDDEGEEA